MNIAFICDWGESSAAILARYSNQTPGNTGRWKNLRGVDDISLADVVIVLGGTDLRIDRDRAILIVREPDFIRKTDTSNYPFAITWSEAHCGVTWWLDKSFDELSAMPIPRKSKLASSIVSGKHEHRNEFLKTLLMPPKKFGLFEQRGKIELFGRGHDPATFGAIYQGPIEGRGNCKFSGLESYKFSLVLENSAQHNYWTEKLADAILSWTFPIYWGCPNIHDFFNPTAVVSIDQSATYVDIFEILRRPTTVSMYDALSESRQRVLHDFNIWEVISKQVELHFHA